MSDTLRNKIMIQGAEDAPIIWPPSPKFEQEENGNQAKKELWIQKKLLVIGYLSLSCCLLGLVTIVAMVLPDETLGLNNIFDQLKTLSTAILTIGFVAGLFSSRLWVGRIGSALSFLLLIVALSACQVC